MATARELLAQADALMRRNRLREDARAIPPAEVVDIPILTEVVDDGVPVGPEPSRIDIEQAIDVAELETEAAVAAATDAALAREAATSWTGTRTEARDALDAIDAAAKASPPMRLDSVAAYEGPEPTSAVSALESAPAMIDAMSSDNGVPVLTDIVEDYEPTSMLGMPETANDTPAWAEFDDDAAIVAASMRTATEGGMGADVPASRDDAALLQEFAPVDAQALVAPSIALPAIVPESAVPVAPVAPADNEARWAALAEEIRMQVLQRIDIFTDTGLQEQLTARLQPIVDRASADLVATINQQVGQLLRAYVAEAIEREIDRWREDSG